MSKLNSTASRFYQIVKQVLTSRQDSQTPPIRIRGILTQRPSDFGLRLHSSVPETTNRKSILLEAAVPVYIVIEIVQEAVPGKGCIDLCRTPPETVAANEVESSIEVTVAAWKACKSTAVV